MASLKRGRTENGSSLNWVSYHNQMKQIKVSQSFDEVFVVTEYMKQELITQGFDEKKIKKSFHLFLYQKITYQKILIVMRTSSYLPLKLFEVKDSIA